MIAPREASIARSALIIVDMQNDFLHKDGCFGWLAGQDPEAQIDMPFLASTIPNAARLIEAYRNARKPVIYVIGAVREDYSDAAFPLRPHQQKVLHRKFCVEGTWGAQVVDELKPRPEEYVIVKKGYGAFNGTPLSTVLRNLDVTTCVVCGVTTCVCVSTTVRGGAESSFRMIVVSDATAETRKDLHEAELHTLEWAFADVRTTSQVVEAVRNAG